MDDGRSTFIPRPYEYDYILHKTPGMKENNKAIALAMAAVLSWSTVATAFKIALTHLTHFEMLLVASITSLIIFTIVLTIQRK